MNLVTFYLQCRYYVDPDTWEAVDVEIIEADGTEVDYAALDRCDHVDLTTSASSTSVSPPDDWCCPNCGGDNSYAWWISEEDAAAAGYRP